MKSGLILALRETGKLTLRYLGVGLCFAVAGTAALLGLQIVGASRSAFIPVALMAGFALSLVFWRATAKETAVPEPVPAIPETIPNVEIQSTWGVYGAEGLDLGQFATSGSIICLCTTYKAEESQPSIETPIHAPTDAPEVNQIHADVH
jgi:hypothetical protein